MHSNVVVGKHRRRVRFPSRKYISPASDLYEHHHHSEQHQRQQQQPQQLNQLQQEEEVRPPGRKRRQQKTSSAKNKMASASAPAIECQPGVPPLFTQLPKIRDQLNTETSKTQDETLETCLPFLKGVGNSQNGIFNELGVPRLNKGAHLAFIYDALEDYPGRFVGLDASKPWMIYWAITALYLLGEDVTLLRKRVISTVAPMQNPTGGFGGGHGQLSHCASSFAVILSLAQVGGPEAFGLIDRLAFWKWLGQLKQPDGGFRVAVQGEEDVRGAYCVMVMIALLDLPIELPPDAPARQFGYDTFVSGLPEYLSTCQSFEGGISGSPGTEAHGAYAFCALACLCILGDPWEMINKHLDFPMLISWMSARQYAPEGGFAGRTNKLVDGCYSHWVGGCWPLVQAALEGPAKDPNPNPNTTKLGSLYNREGLTRYILGCCQGPYGGLRDKPGKHPDAYHTCYTMAGLSSTQNYHFNTHQEHESSSKRNFSSAFSWDHCRIPSAETSPPENRQDGVVFDESDRLNALHPLFTIGHSAAEQMRLWYESNPVVGFTAM